MLTTEQFDLFTVYKLDEAACFVYANFDKPALFMEGMADYILRESNLLNYANSMTQIEFTPSPAIYKKLYSTIGSFLNSELEMLSYDNVSQTVYNTLGDEYTFINYEGETRVQKDKIGKIGEYIFHVILTHYYGFHCILPKFRCITDRNMSVFGIDTLFLDYENRKILFGESKFCKNITNAITLINRSLSDYESQISDEYRLVLSNDECFSLSQEFLHAFKTHTSICVTFDDFIKNANIKSISVPTFIAHGNSTSKNDPIHFLNQMKSGIKKQNFFGLDTEYILISLPVIDKAKMVDIIMRKVVKKASEYRNQQSSI